VGDSGDSHQVVVVGTTEGAPTRARRRPLGKKKEKEEEGMTF